MTDPSARHREWRPGRAVSPHLVLGVFRRGPGDPTFRIAPDGSVVRALRCPDGSPVTLQIRARPDRGEVTATAWGPGAAWVIERLPDLLGAQDDDSGFAAHHEQVALARTRFPGWRVPRSGLVLDAAVPAVIEQKVTGRQAFSAWRQLIRRFGAPAPGPWGAVGLLVPPDASGWRRIPSWSFARAGVESRQAETLVRLAGVAGRLEEAAANGPPAVARRMRAIRGVGEWTVAEVAQRALGDSDAVSFGDYHVARDIGWALLGRAIGDDELRELLVPYAGHRYRVQRLLELAGARHPRRGPRRPLPAHLPG